MTVKHGKADAGLREYAEAAEWVSSPRLKMNSVITAARTPLDARLRLDSYMTETNGGGRLENIPGIDTRRAMTAGLPGGVAFPNSASLEAARPEAVFDHDDRVLVTNTAQVPWRSVCHLLIEREDGRLSFGTGWFAGPRLLVTAGHCILAHSQGGWATSITVVPGSNGTYPPPFGTFAVTAKEIHPAWRDQADPRFDIGLLQLDDGGIGIKLGWFGVSVIDDQQAAQLLVNIGGYPHDRTRGTLWFNAGRITTSDEYFFKYMVDTYAGQSGSPVFWYGSQGERIAVAVHTYSELSNNKGRRIREDIFNRILALKDL